MSGRHQPNASVPGRTLFAFALGATLTCIAHADSFRYDNQGRLVTATYASGSQLEYRYDANGNMTSQKSYAAKWSTTDQDHNNIVSLAELLRVIQFYNSGGYHCQAGTEDGYAPAPGDQGCPAHSSDYSPANFVVTLAELLRQIQFYNSLGYSYCPSESTEDGYCPGL